MKRKLRTPLSIFLVLLAAAAVYTYCRYNRNNISYASASNSEYLKAFDITFEPARTEPKINKRKIHGIVNKMMWNSVLKPSEICVQYGLISDNCVTVNVFSNEALDANPDLKNKTSISQIPVWLVTFKGLQGKNYTGDISGPSGRRPLDTSTVVIDAVSGKVLYTFGTSARY